MFSSPPTITATLHGDGVDDANAKLRRMGFANSDKHHSANIVAIQAAA
jgi:hypothetical protein